MSASSKTNSQTIQNLNGGETVEVLYQKMGNRWFAFSLVGEEVFVGSITQEEVDALEAQNEPQMATRAPEINS